MLEVAAAREGTEPDAEVQWLQSFDLEELGHEDAINVHFVSEAPVAGVDHQLERQHVIAELAVPGRQHVRNEGDFLQAVASGFRQSFSDSGLLLSDEPEQHFVVGAFLEEGGCYVQH